VNHRIPEPIQPTLQNLIALVNQQLPGLIKAFYLEGSIALGGFNERSSDIDFVAILERQTTLTEIESLRHIHEVVEKTYPQWEMSGSYLRWDDFSCPEKKSKPILYFHDGTLKHNGHFEFSSVEGWILKNHGIPIIGPDPQELPFTVDWHLLIKKMRENLNCYWVSWTRRPNRIIIMLSDWGIQWAVLGVLRQFYSFRENTITTKVKAGEYALTCLSGRWHRLIREAINIREGQSTSLYHSKVMRTVEAIRFLKFIISTCNADFAKGQPTAF
jgi:hypothetical protein